jgi:hypothetical protein
LHSLMAGGHFARAGALRLLLAALGSGIRPTPIDFADKRIRNWSSNFEFS